MKELKSLLKECNDIVRKHHLPIILDNYFIELTDAKEAILEIEKDLAEYRATGKKGGSL